MRRILIYIAVLLQAGVLIFMAAEREYIIRFGKIVRLRTAPVDPRDPFRGDYVSLNYEISNIPLKILKEKLPSCYEQRRDITVYTILKKCPDGVFKAEACTLKKPKDGSIFIRGKIDRWSGSVDEKRFIRVEYGIEKYFVQQGKGTDIEKRAGRGNDIYIPLEMNVALNNNGVAIAKDFSWSPLGIGLEIVAQPTRSTTNVTSNGTIHDNSAPQSNQRRSIKVKLILKNCSDKDIAIVNLPDYSSFSIEPSEFSSKIWEFNHIAKTPEQVTDEYVKVLKPDESMEFFFDFADSRWFVNVNGVPQEIGVATGNTWGTTFRIRYCPPPPEKCYKLKNTNLIWHGELISRNFSPGGYID